MRKPPRAPRPPSPRERRRPPAAPTLALPTKGPAHEPGRLHEVPLRQPPRPHRLDARHRRRRHDVRLHVPLAEGQHREPARSPARVPAHRRHRRRLPPGQRLRPDPAAAGHDLRCRHRIPGRCGEEESGQLDLVLAHPLTRTRLVLQRFAALATGAGAISALVWLALLAIRDSAELTSVTPGELLAQCVNLALLGIVFGALALGLGAAFGRRAVVLAATAAIGILAYTAHTFAAQIGADQLAYLSPFHHYIGGQPLRNGFQWVDIGILSATASALVGLGAWRFARRDINT
ncbi:ABC transporter permease [Streptomyces collinus]|uniref:ABC transporter permease n=1 Tax=Streptomyces collinus TaxID=42684 RepID=UPI0033CF064D